MMRPHFIAWGPVFLGIVLSFTVVLTDVQAGATVAVQSGVQSLCPDGPPGTVVRAYYAAAVHHQPAAVRACFARSVVATMLGGNGTHAPWNNILMARVTRTVVRSVPVSYLGRRGGTTFTAVDLRQVLVTVVMKYKRVEGTALHNGPNALFFYLAQQLPGSPWRIVAIGTGP